MLPAGSCAFAGDRPTALRGRSRYLARWAVMAFRITGTLASEQVETLSPAHMRRAE
jgi:hypothetical protein